MSRRAPAHAGTAEDQARIMRRILGRAEARQRDARLDPVDRDVLNVLDRLVVLGYGDGRIGVRKLAELVHRTPRTVRRHLARLECLGYLEIGERSHGHGGPACNRYRVLSPGAARGAQAWAARREARAARDRERKRPRRGGGVLTRRAPAHTRGRVNARSGTGEQSRQRPTVPVGQADRQEDATMPMRAGRWISPTLGERGPVRTADPGREREGPTLPPVREGAQDPDTAAAEVEAARRRIADLAARGSAASGWGRR